MLGAITGYCMSQEEKAVRESSVDNKDSAEVIRSLVETVANDERVTAEMLGDALEVADQLDDGSSPSSIDGLVEIDQGFTVGDLVADRNPQSFVEKAGLANLFEVVEVTDDRADEHTVKPACERPENHDQTVSDVNPGYPEDDRVVRVSPISRDAVYSYPESRLRVAEE